MQAAAEKRVPFEVSPCSRNEVVELRNIYALRLNRILVVAVRRICWRLAA